MRKKVTLRTLAAAIQTLEKRQRELWEQKRTAKVQHELLHVQETINALNKEKMAKEANDYLYRNRYKFQD